MSGVRAVSLHIIAGSDRERKGKRKKEFHTATLRVSVWPGITQMGFAARPLDFKCDCRKAPNQASNATENASPLDQGMDKDVISERLRPKVHGKGEHVMGLQRAATATRDSEGKKKRARDTRRSRKASLIRMIPLADLIA